MQASGASRRLRRMSSDALAPAALGEHRRHHRPAATRTRRRSTAAGRREPARRTARQRRALLGRDPGQFFETAAGHPQMGFTQFIVKHTTERPLETPVGELEDRPRRPSGRASASTPARPPAARWRPSKRRRCGCPPGSQSRRKPSSRPRCSRSASTAAGRRLTKSPSTTSIPPPGRAGALRPRTRAATKSSSKATSPGTATTTRASRSTFPERRRLEPLSAADPEKPPRLRTAAPATAPSSPRPPPASAEAFTGSPGRVYSTLLLASSWKRRKRRRRSRLRLPAERRARLRVADSARDRRRRNAPRSPMTRRSRSTRKPRRPTRPPARRPGLGSRSSPAATTRRAPTRSDARLALPAGMGLNPSAANGLQACTDAQFGKGTTNPVACPPASKIGTVDDRIAAAPRTADPRRQRLRRQAAEPRPGLGRRVPDLHRRRVGPLRRLGAADRQRQRRPADRAADHDFSETPQVPFTSFGHQLNGGPQATLTSPPTCGPHTTDGDDDPVVGQPGRDAGPTSSP